MTNQEKADVVNDYIAHTMGTQEYHKSGLPRITYTDGVKLVAETCGAYWLIDIIASVQWEIRRARAEFAGFQVWYLTKKLDYWVISCWSDTPGESTLLTSQKIEYSDFPDELLPFTMWVEQGTIILPAEH